MKIAMVGQFPPHVGGVGVHIHTLARELVKKGGEHLQSLKEMLKKH